MTEFRFKCPRCGSTHYGTITRSNGSKAYACHGIIHVDRVAGVSKSCDFEIPITGHEPKRTREERAETITSLLRATEQLARGLAQCDPDDELALSVVEDSLGEMQSMVILLRDDAVSARIERARVGVSS